MSLLQHGDVVTSITYGGRQVGGRGGWGGSQSVWLAGIILLLIILTSWLFWIGDNLQIMNWLGICKLILGNMVRTEADSVVNGAYIVLGQK